MIGKINVAGVNPPVVTAGENWLLTLAGPSNISFGTNSTIYATCAAAYVNLIGTVRIKMEISADTTNNRAYRILRNGSTVASDSAADSLWTADVSVSPGDVLEFQALTEGGSANYELIGFYVAEVVSDLKLTARVG